MSTFAYITRKLLDHLTTCPTRLKGLTTITLGLGLALALALGACGGIGVDASGGGPGGKADRREFELSVRELGPLSLGVGQQHSQRAPIDGTVPAFRVESFGDTVLELRVNRVGLDAPTPEAEEAGAPHLIVQGPFEDPDATPAEYSIWDDLSHDYWQTASNNGYFTGYGITVRLPTPGLYRVIVATTGAFQRGLVPDQQLVLKNRCRDNCFREAISARTFVEGLRGSGQLEKLTALAEAKLAEMLPAGPLRDALAAQLKGIIADGDLRGIERFPTLPLRALAGLRPLLGLAPPSAPRPEKVVSGNLRQQLGACDGARRQPTPLSEAMPTVRRGHFADLALTPCQATHSERLAQLLTSLAADNGSALRYDGKTISTPRELFEALLSSGHSIEVRNERVYANFIGLVARDGSGADVDVVWPAWLDTGVELADGRSLTVPMGHSHHAWRISGKHVNARVMFYLGVDGAGFWAQTQGRPAWTGLKVRYAAASDESDEAIANVLKTVEVASAYLRRIHVERATHAAKLPADGYGYLGVCNDSTAVIEHQTWGTITTFPLVRAAELDQAAPLSDGLDATLAALPHDADVAPARAEALRRIFEMTPFSVTSTYLVDDELRSQLQTAKAEL